MFNTLTFSVNAQRVGDSFILRCMPCSSCTLPNIEEIVRIMRGESTKWQTSINDFGVYFLICVYRVLNALFIETQFDPDEYWQCLEPAYCLAIESETNCAYTWEWTRRRNINEDIDITGIDWIDDAMYGPVRSFVPILPTYFLYKNLVHFNIDTTWAISSAPLILNAVVVAAPVDFGVFYVSRYIGDVAIKKESSRQNFHYWALFASLTNWFNGYALVRTYSNALEASLLSIGICLLRKELFDDVNEKEDFQVRRLAQLAFILGGLSVVIRFTALASWVPIGLALCWRRKSSWSKFYYLWNVCIIPAIIGVIIGCIIDRHYYGFWAIPFLGNFHFNVLLDNGSLYGTHPFYWYILEGLPAIAGVLTPFYIVQSIQCWKGQDKKAFRTLLAVIVSYIVLHSISGHKEFRFILPILSFISILAGRCISKFLGEDSLSLQSRRKKGIVVITFFLLNYPHLAFLARIHQRTSQVNRYITNHSTHTNKKDLSVHYLMGCHSTPVYSHLHVKREINGKSSPMPIDVWYLDCSPRCRKDPYLTCESDYFSSDPSEFIRKRYGLEKEECANIDTTCIGDEMTKSIPDFIAIFEEDLYRGGSKEVQDLLRNDLGLEKISTKFRYAVKRVSLKKLSFTMDDSLEAVIVPFPVIHRALIIEFEHIVLFAR